MQTQQSGKAPHRAFIKYSALTCAAAALTALTSPVQAQSSNVTMYGYIDVGVQSVTGYGSGNVTSYSNQRKTAMAEGYRNWLGFSGKEDLGDGLAATFNLQMRFQPGTGAIEEPGGTPTLEPDKVTAPLLEPVQMLALHRLAVGAHCKGSI